MVKKKKDDGSEKSAIQLAQEKQAALEEAGFNRLLGGGVSPNVLAPKKDSKKKRESIEAGPALDDLVCLSVLESVIKAMRKKALELEKPTVWEHFFETMQETRTKSDSFDVVSTTGKTSGQWQFAKAAFSEEIAKTLTAAGIKFETETKISAGWMLNPDLVRDEPLIRRLLGVIEAHPDFKNVEVFIPQAGKVTYKLDKDYTVPQIFAKIPEKDQEAIIQEIGSIRFSQTKIEGQKSNKKKPDVSLLRKAFQMLSESGRIENLVELIKNDSPSDGDDEEE